MVWCLTCRRASLLATCGASFRFIRRFSLAGGAREGGREMPNRIDVVVTYDVNTLTKEGRRRLRQVAKVCEGCGQRVQWSVFECRVTETELERLRQRLCKTMDADEDSIRIYRLRGRRQEVVEAYGRDGYVDFEEPLIL